MRVTEHRLMEISSAAVSRAREAAAKAGNQLSSGVEVERASDDPTRWAQGRLAQARKTVSAGHERALDRARGRLEETDGVLDGISEQLRRAQELALQMATGTMSAAERTNAAAEVATLKESMIALANRRGGDGEYLLAGAAGTAAPFDATGAYVGSPDERAVVAGEASTVVAAVTGARLTAASGTDVLALVDTLRSALASNDVAATRATLGPLSQSIDQLAAARAAVGIRMEAVDHAEQSRSALEASLDTELDRTVAADPIAAASRFARAAQALEAARAAAARIAELLDR